MIDATKSLLRSGLAHCCAQSADDRIGLPPGRIGETIKIDHRRKEFFLRRNGAAHRRNNVADIRIGNRKIEQASPDKTGRSENDQAQRQKPPS
jgi:hypothetical protein